MSYDCNREPNLGRCMKCPSHCECEAEAEEFTSREFELFRAGFDEGYKKGYKKGIGDFMLKAIKSYYESEDEDGRDGIDEAEIHRIERELLS